MIGKSQIKRVASLQQKKFRKEYRQFVAEGPKVIGEFLQSEFKVKELYATQDEAHHFGQRDVMIVSNADLARMSSLTTPSGSLAVIDMPDAVALPSGGVIVALDEIRDPGNLGTIIRLCDWFGVRHLLLSESSVDAFNPKVVQATMGSMARVSVMYVDLPQFLQQSSLPVFGTFMDGDNIYKTNLPQDGIVVFGNESNGISPEVEACVGRRISIPRFGELQRTESLNVATAAAIVLSEFRRG